MCHSAMQDRLADTAAAVSVTVAGWTWLAQANELAQFVATVVAIISGLAAITYHVLKIRDRKHERRTN